MLKKLGFECPLCGGIMLTINCFDGIKKLKCETCRCEIHFGSWEQQNKFTDK